MNATIFKFLLFAFGFSFFAGGDKTQAPNEPAQVDTQAIIDSIQRFYTSRDYIYHELSYSLYADHTSSVPHSVEKGLFIKQGDVQYSRLSSVESLITPEYSLGIDHDEKLIMISNLISLPANSPVGNMARWVPDGVAISIHSVSDQLNALSVKAKYGEVEEVEIVYDIHTFQPVKFVLKYRRAIQLDTETDTPPVQPKMEIDYLFTGFDGQEKERLNLNAYALEKAGHWTLAPQYRGYEMINNIHESPFEN